MNIYVWKKLILYSVKGSGFRKISNLTVICANKTELTDKNYLRSFSALYKKNSLIISV